MVTKNTDFNLNRISVVVCNYYGITPEQMQSKCRKREIVLTRKVIWNISKKLLKDKISLEKLGSRIGSKTYPDVIHGIKTINNFNDVDKIFKAQYDEILRQCQDVLLMQHVHEKTNIEVLEDILKYENKNNIKIALRELINELKA